MEEKSLLDQMQAVLSGLVDTATYYWGCSKCGCPGSTYKAVLKEYHSYPVYVNEDGGLTVNYDAEDEFVDSDLESIHCPHCDYDHKRVPILVTAIPEGVANDYGRPSNDDGDILTPDALAEWKASHPGEEPGLCTPTLF